MICYFFMVPQIKYEKRNGKVDTFLESCVCIDIYFLIDFFSINCCCCHIGVAPLLESWIEGREV